MLSTSEYIPCTYADATVPSDSIFAYALQYNNAEADDEKEELKELIMEKAEDSNRTFMIKKKRGRRNLDMVYNEGAGVLAKNTYDLSKSKFKKEFQIRIELKDDIVAKTREIEESIQTYMDTLTTLLNSEYRSPISDTILLTIRMKQEKREDGQWASNGYPDKKIKDVSTARNTRTGISYEEFDREALHESCIHELFGKGSTLSFDYTPRLSVSPKKITLKLVAINIKLHSIPPEVDRDNELSQLPEMQEILTQYLEKEDEISAQLAGLDFQVSD